MIAETPTPAARARLADRWPTALALTASAGAIVVLIMLDRDAELFGPQAVMMMGIYLMAYAIGRPATAWLAVVVFSAVLAVLQALDGQDALPAGPAVGMSVVVLLVWLWAVLRRRYTDGQTFRLETAGMVGFGIVTLVCAAIEPRWATLLAGVGFLAHAGWDAYHYRANKVVNRPYAEFCGVVDVVVGLALVVAAVAG